MLRRSMLVLLWLGSAVAVSAQPPPAREVSIDRLWATQPALVAKAMEGLRPRIAGQTNVYAVAVAAGGKQPLFAREAKLALDVVAARFGADYRGGILLSNAHADLLKKPVAVPATLAVALRGLADRIDPAQDVAFLYLASHGSPDAELETDLPGFDNLAPVSARSVADAFKKAGIRRRVIIVSACFAGSWAPALAGPDTILIAAARRDRTSFGCDNTRTLTWFGEAMLQGPLADGASLHEAFDAARARVAREEAGEKLLPSQPQAYVGKNMRELWDMRTVPAAITPVGALR